MGKLLDYALLAQRAYSQKPDIGVESSASRAILETTPDGLCVAFPGSDNIACFIADLDAVVTDTPLLGRLHNGFWETYLKMAVELAELTPNVITGHSLGGSLALIYGAHRALMGHAPKMIYAYEPAMPSVDPIMRSILDAAHVQVTITHNGRDIVPCIHSISDGWQMPGNVTELCQTSAPYPHISDDPIACIEDHLLPNVIKSIRALNL